MNEPNANPSEFSAHDDDMWSPEDEAYFRAQTCDPVGFEAGLNSGYSWPTEDPAYRAGSPEFQQAYESGYKIDREYHRRRTKDSAEAEREYKRKQRERARRRAEKEWKAEGFDPTEFVAEYDKRRPGHPSDKAALLDVSEELGTPCGSGDEDQKYRNLRERLATAREYVQRGTPNSQGG